ncbi:hypothetical protein V1478_010978 [Vespula squamosa]|uniref:Maturase K n=1 Tax=Vespula squamosa TaxID=30214 RepID=A0ABD2AFW1_VESSQ
MNVKKVGGTIGSTSPFSRALFEPFVHSHPTIFKGTSQDAFLRLLTYFRRFICIEDGMARNRALIDEEYEVGGSRCLP